MADQPISIIQATSPGEVEAAERILREYISWVFTISEDPQAAPTFHGIDEELANLPGVYAPPSGRLLLAMHEGQVAGCVCLKGHDAATSEVKRLYVSPAKRGLSIGSLLVGRLVEEARLAGYRRIVLDSHKSMQNAHAIYEGAGFRRVPPPSDVPEFVKQVAVFMECDLGL